MFNNSKFLHLLFGIFVFTHIILNSAFSPDACAQVPKIHEEMPDFSLPKLEGGDFSLSDLEGKSNVVLVTVRGWVGYW